MNSSRQPCVIRGAGNDLDIVRGCSCCPGITNSNDRRGIAWLAEQAGSSIFRVFVSGPAQRENAKQSSIDCNTTPPSTFTLDGTSHPDAILTTSMSLEVTLTDMMNNQDWKARYMVEDNIPEGRLQALIPPRPPSPLLNAFVHDSSIERAEPIAKQRQLFVSFGPCQTQLHRDCFDNIYVCAFGERHWTITAPNDTLEREPGSVSAASCAYEASDSIDFYRATLRAGDAIFVPANFWHSVRSDEAASVALNWYYGPIVFLQPNK